MAFSTATLAFLRGLKRHNDRAWFEANRPDYEAEVKQPMRELIEEMDVRLTRFAPEIIGDPKRSMFRINRDIRFSKDKSPYKTHAACWFHHLNASRHVGAGDYAGSAGYYFHIEPGGRSMIGGGIWMPPRPQLNKLRKAISDPDVVAKFKQLGTVPFPEKDQSPAAHARLFAADLPRVAKLVESSGAKPSEAQ